ncbi:sugar phosphate isomerase/epimerase family protein [Vallitalea okinawensis]|uniref:sugar phosphate isomerase/epimerase family protein n=1 Tax=Vallitalea okinawensis TaxID=2078660 RepID=UPI000CFA9933|nr:TIM barrel protein [Vallitalea okinawensis]
MINNFSCSSSWNVHKAEMKDFSGYDMLKEIKELGFNQVELNYNVTEQMIREMYPLIESGQMTVSSLHNVCPKASPEFGPSSVFLGFEDNDKRRQAIEYTIRTVEYANRLDAEAIVIHSSKVIVCPEDDGYYNDKLRRVYLNDGVESQAYSQLFEEAISLRQRFNLVHTELIINSLEEICNYMAKKNIHVKLGLENRANYHEIPNSDEYEMIFTGLQGAPVYMWYDIGHGEMLDRLKTFDGHKVLEKYKDKLLGVHIHDLNENFEDHFAPYTKSNVLDNYLEYIHTAQIKVLELCQYNTPEMIKSGVSELIRRLN